MPALSATREPEPRQVAPRAALWTLYVASRMLMASTFYYSDLFSYLRRLTTEAPVLPEYGPLAQVIIYLPRLFPDWTEQAQYVTAMKALALVVDGMLVHALMRRRSLLPAVTFLLGSALLYRVWLDRLDLYVAALFVVAVTVTGRRRALALAAASLVKFPFAALGIIGWIQDRSAQSRQVFWWTLGSFVVPTLVLAALIGPDGTLTPFFFHGGRTLQMEGIVGNLIYAGVAFFGWHYDVEIEHHAAHIHGAQDGLLRALGLGILLIGVAVTAVRLWRLGPRVSHGGGLLLAVVAYTAFNPVGSPQFAIVPLALAPFTPEGSRDRLAALLLVFYALMVDQAFAHYVQPPEIGRTFALCTLLRNVVLLAYWGMLMLRVGSPQPAEKT